MKKKYFNFKKRHLYAKLEMHDFCLDARAKKVSFLLLHDDNVCTYVSIYNKGCPFQSLCMVARNSGAMNTETRPVNIHICHGKKVAGKE